MTRSTPGKAENGPDPGTEAMLTRQSNPELVKPSWSGRGRAKSSVVEPAPFFHGMMRYADNGKWVIETSGRKESLMIGKVARPWRPRTSGRRLLSYL